ncbi:MAG: isocitrate lyase/phosphoenolpyruvate mutase family protein [Acidimicrobiia bacterium]|nr:isocitrate lyase/phosphoenolpyruvate mutase family protein [Acidimicrobiia bacterium]
METSSAQVLRDLHDGDDLFVLPNPYDLGTAKLLTSMGFAALATTSAGLARTLGRPDGARSVSAAEAIEHARQMTEATDLPVTGDFEDGFAVDPAGVADTVSAARAAGVAGCCIEDATYDRSDPIHDLLLATDRIAAAAEAAHTDGHPFVLTARAENMLYGVDDLADTIARVSAYAAAGADAVYAPGLVSLDHISRVVEAVEVPVNVLIGLPGQDWSLADLAVLGVRRVSVGSAFSRAAFAAVHHAAQQLLDTGRLEPRGAGLPDLDSLFAAD